MNHTHTETDLPIENQYPKLVRDLIPERIERDGKKLSMHIADHDEYLSYLLMKLIEEASELKQAESLDHQKEEIADVREVLNAIQEALKLSDEELEKVQTSKANERGGFSARIILDEKPE